MLPHCPGDMIARMRTVMSTPWAAVGVFTLDQANFKTCFSSKKAGLYSSSFDSIDRD